MYHLHDCYGIPQCGYEITNFETWGELEEYLTIDSEMCIQEFDEYTEYPIDSILWRIANGYAAIVEV